MAAELMRSATVCADIPIIDAAPAHLTKRNEPPTALVPKDKAHALEALQQRKPAHAAKFGMIAEHPRQAVIRNTAAEVMDMVHADVGCKPAQNSRKVVVRAAIQGRLFKAPATLMRPERHLELVLHVEQPYTDRSREQHDWQMYQEEGPHADEPDQSGDNRSDCDIGRHRTEPRLPTVTKQADRKPVLQDEQIGRTYAEHDERVAVRPVAKPPPERERQIFLHGECIDVTDATSLQVA